jgi:hypothetical protein
MRVALVGVLVLLTGCLQPISLPQPDVSIEPAAPDDADDLVLVIDDLGDNPAAIAWAIEWQRDGETQADLANTELVPTNRTTSGEEWAAVVFLVLGDQTGPAGQATVTIGGDSDDDDMVDDDDGAPDDDDVQDDDDIGPNDDDSSDDSSDDDDDVGPNDDDSADCVDTDGDGWCSPDDCDDGDDGIYPGADELCDGLDTDCDGSVVDEFTDTDGDQEPDCTDLDDDGDSFPDSVDCAPTDPVIYPNAPETCDNVDSDCDGSMVDDDPDLDGDGLPDCVDSDVDGDGAEGPLGANTDCDDADSNVFPSQMAFFTVPLAGGTWDYDCDGTETLELTLLAAQSTCCFPCNPPNCALWTEGWICASGTDNANCAGIAGWSLLGCGESAPYITQTPMASPWACCDLVYAPINTGNPTFLWSSTRTQGCR